MNNKRIPALIFTVLLTVIMTVSVFAEDSLVIFHGRDYDMEFSPGSVYSATDLFDTFKGIMPGDVLTEEISVKHQGDIQHYAKIYIRTLGVSGGNEAFLSKLRLTVTSQSKSLFDAPANETDGLTNWTHLATLDYGEWVDLNVTLSVPADLDDAFQFTEGYIDWEFMVEAIPKGYIPINPPKHDYIRYRVQANYFTDGVADNEIPFTFFYSDKAEELPDIDKIVERYSTRTIYGENKYIYTETVFDSETNTYTLRFDRTTEVITPDPDPEPVYTRYTVEAKYYTNGILDIFVPVFASSDVESLPELNQISALYSHLTTVNGVEYKFTVAEFDEETNTYTLRFDRLSEQKPDPAPSTGDNSKITLWISLAVTAFVILILLLVVIKKKKDENK